jgi:predicted permease
MKSLRAWMKRLAGVFATSKADRELDAELESHLQLHIDDCLRAGLPPAEARRRALIALGGVAQTTEQYRDRRGLPAFESLVRDVRFGARSLARTPGFTAAAIVILGLGIGANSAIFTVVNAVVLRPLPFANADRIMRLWQTPPASLFPGESTFPLSPANFIDWEAQARSFERMAIYRGGRPTLTGQGRPEAVVALRGSADFLPILGLTPVHGRFFTKDEDRAGGPRTVLLAQRFHHTKFGGDPAIIGRTITLDGVPHEVVGIVPDAPVFIQRAQVWMPLAWTPEDRATRSNHNYRAIAKLRAGVTVESAQTELTAVNERLAKQYPEDNTDWGGLVRPLQLDLVGDVRESLLLLLGAVALVLLIACANLANLILARTHGRAKELALRTALGASRARVVRQLVTEGALLGAGGGLAGLAAVYYGVRGLTAAFGDALPRAGEVQVDVRVLVFTTVVALATGLIASVIPALKLTGRRAVDPLRTGPSRGSSATGDGRMRNLLVVSEVALALMLLVGAGLLLRSLVGLRGVDPGFDPRNLLTATVQIPRAKYPTEEHRVRFFTDALRVVRSLPGVESAAWVENVPLAGGGSSQYVQPEGMPVLKESEMPVVALRMASPGYFKTMRISMLSGRDFTDDDKIGAHRVVIVSERTAKRFWPDQNPLGKKLTLTMITKEPAEVIGVVREIKLGSLDASLADSETAVYAPSRQFPYNGSAIVLRTKIAPESLSQELVKAIESVDSEQPVLDIQTMASIAETSLGQRPVAMQLLAAFSLLAVVLASLGIYSVLAYTVRQRVREIGIRMALGAPAGGVLRLVIVEGLKPTLAGVAVGLFLAALLTGVMNTLLFQVSQRDPGTFMAVAGLMVLVGLVATAVPAWRATRVDPVTTLRSE